MLMLAPVAAKADCHGIDAISTTWAADWSAKKLDAVMALYAPDAVFLPSSHPRWAGTAELRKQFAALQSAFDPDIRVRSAVCETSGDLAYDSGSYNETLAPAKGGAALHFEGDYLFVFKREAGGWKILEQTFTAYDPNKL